MSRVQLVIRVACDLIVVFAGLYARMLDDLLIDLGYYEAYSGNSQAIIVIGYLVTSLGFASWHYTIRDLKCWWNKRED